MADSRDVLLDTFRDNNAQLISAADMRELINALYDEKSGIIDIVDNLLSIETDFPLSANQGRVLKVLIDALTITVDGNTSAISTNLTNLTDADTALGNRITTLENSHLAGLTTSFVIADGSTVTVTDGLITAVTAP